MQDQSLAEPKSLAELKSTVQRGTHISAGRSVGIPQSQLDLRPSGIVVALVGYLGPSGFIP